MRKRNWLPLRWTRAEPRGLVQPLGAMQILIQGTGALGKVSCWREHDLQLSEVGL